MVIAFEKSGMVGYGYGYDNHNHITIKWLFLSNHNQGWTNTNTYRANTGVCSCSHEHERTRTRIFQTSEHERTRTRILCEVLNTNEHEHSFFKKCRTRTNTCFFEIIEHREHERTRTLVDFHPCFQVNIVSHLCSRGFHQNDQTRMTFMDLDSMKTSFRPRLREPLVIYG